VIGGLNIGEIHRLTGNDDIVGRQEDVWLHLADSEVSRRHAEFEQTDGAIHVRDLGSTNGTFVNGEQITDHQLAEGDKIRIGATTLRFSYLDDIDRTFLDQMYKSAVRDGLTGASNRKHFIERLDGEFAFAERHNTSVLLVMFDIDNFKHVNDTWGHLAGDHVIATLAQRAMNMIRREDVLGRYGGDEFGLISRDINLTDGGAFANRIRVAIDKTEFMWEKDRLPVTVSMGVASSLTSGISDAKALLAAADAALYTAKQQGRNQVTFHGSDEPLAQPSKPADKSTRH
jgi:diguanylate cyclase (GGDEF)-like protein|tara:strand:+ start:424 stop:1284 length:861 start_codon:yes stop_codon:yes gene_type:complete